MGSYNGFIGIILSQTVGVFSKKKITKTKEPFNYGTVTLIDGVQQVSTFSALIKLRGGYNKKCEIHCFIPYHGVDMR